MRNSLYLTPNRAVVIRNSSGLGRGDSSKNCSSLAIPCCNRNPVDDHKAHDHSAAENLVAEAVVEPRMRGGQLTAS